VEFQQMYTNRWYSAEYWSFKIGDELNTKYRLEVAGYSGDAGDALQYTGETSIICAFSARIACVSRIAGYYYKRHEI